MLKLIELSLHLAKPPANSLKSTGNTLTAHPNTRAGRALQRHGKRAPQVGQSLTNARDYRTRGRVWPPFQPTSNG